MRAIRLVFVILGLIAGPAAAQDGVEAAYRAALAVSPTPRTLEADQREWVADLERADAAERADVVAARAERLAAGAERDGRIAALRPTLEDLMAGCVDLGLQSCSADGGWLAAGERRLFWQTQRGVTDEDGITGAAMVLEARSDGSLRPLVWVSGAFFETPKVFGEGDAWLAIPGVFAGTGRGAADVAFAFGQDHGAVRQIDTVSWRDDLPGKLPRGLEVWKGVTIDYDEMFAFTPLWQAGDGNCCATGGTAVLNFEISDDRLVLTNVSANDALSDLAMTTPSDVFDYVGRVQGCNHWGGEEGYDADRRAQIEAALRDLRCDAVEADGAALRAKYADEDRMLSILARVES